MNTFKYFFKIIESPLGIALAFTQWIVVLFAFLGDKPEPGFGNSTYLLHYLVSINYPALMSANLITDLLGFLFNTNGWFYILLMILCISLQWIFIGKLIELFLENTREESVNILK
jgi:hypothetical protein